jgi:hypothetical protein
MKGALTMNNESSESRRVGDPADRTKDSGSQYYPICPLKQKVVPLTKCFSCEFVAATGSNKCINIMCGFPSRRRK